MLVTYRLLINSRKDLPMSYSFCLISGKSFPESEKEILILLILDDHLYGGIAWLPLTHHSAPHTTVTRMCSHPLFLFISLVPSFNKTAFPYNLD